MFLGELQQATLLGMCVTLEFEGIAGGDDGVSGAVKENSANSKVG